MARFVQKMRGPVSFVEVGVKATANELDSATPRITSGTGAPTAALADGSIYFQTDGTDATDSLHMRIAGAWVALDGS